MPLDLYIWRSRLAGRGRMIGNHVNVRYIGEIGLEMALSSTSGDVSAVCGGINSKGKKKVQERFGEPDSKLKASTISGDIKVRDC